MNEINWQKFDLNLLTVFSLLMQELSLTAVAHRLSLGQPAISHALARLRKLTGDPLFVRSGRLMEPTHRAKALYREVGPALETIESALRDSQPFDPSACERTLKIAMSDDVQMAYLPKITKLMRQRLPKARLVVQQTDYLRAANMLEHKQASIVIGYLDKLPAAAKLRKLKRVGYRAIARKELFNKLNLAEYCTHPHVLVTFAGDLTGYVDESLAKLDVERRIKLSVPAFGLLPFLLQGSPYIATIPEYVASVMAGNSGLRETTLPFKSPEFDLSMAWREVSDNDPAEKILRNIIIETVGGRQR